MPFVVSEYVFLATNRYGAGGSKVLVNGDRTTIVSTPLSSFVVQPRNTFLNFAEVDEVHVLEPVAEENTSEGLGFGGKLLKRHNTDLTAGLRSIPPRPKSSAEL